MSKSLILASSSSYRQALLAKLGLEFKAVTPAVDETALADESVTDMVLRLSKRKAQALASRYPNSIIIGSDQCGMLAGQRLGKAGNETAAIKQLQACSGKQVRFYTGLVLLQAAQNSYWQYCETFDVTFRKLTLREIQGYIAKEQPFDCAGSFKCEGLGITLFESMNGRDPNSLVGLPLIALVDGLRYFNINPLTN